MSGAGGGAPSDAWRTQPGAPAPGTVLCRLDDLQDGAVTLVVPPGGSGAEPFSLLLLREGTAVRAYLNRCPHFGVPLSQTQTHLKFEAGVSLSCNVHYARFRWADGQCDRGECVGEGLQAVPLTVDAAGEISIGT